MQSWFFSWIHESDDGVTTRGFDITYENENATPADIGGKYLKNIADSKGFPVSQIIILAMNKV
jgi:hypothetical protein